MKQWLGEAVRPWHQDDIVNDVASGLSCLLAGAVLHSEVDLEAFLLSQRSCSYRRNKAPGLLIV